MDSNLWEDFDNFDFKGGIDSHKKMKETQVEKNNEESKEKKLKPSEKLLLDIKGEGFDLSQMEEILKAKGNQLIISCAGSGKTTTLVFKLIYALKTGYATRLLERNGTKLRVTEKIWVSTFLKTGAIDLEASTRKWNNRLHCTDTSSAITFSTLHAEFKRALEAMGNTILIIDDKENSALLKDVVKAYQLKNANGRSLNADDYRNLEGALTFTRNRLDHTRYEQETYVELGIGSTIIDSILHEWRAKRVAKGVYDFEDLQEVLFRECYVKNNEEVISFISKRYNFIYIDEFQDTSQIQYKILQVYGMGCKQVVAIGDDDQTIYSWRGSDNNIILKEFQKDFNPVKQDLSINFRCPSNILKAIAPSIEKNEFRFAKNLTSSREGGQVRLVSSNSYTKMVETLSNLVYEDVKNGKSVAILCRVNSDGLMPALLFDKIDKFAYSISGDNMTLNSYIGRTVLSIIKLFTERSTSAVKSALGQLTYDSYCIDNLMKVCKANKKLSIWTIDKEDLAYSCPSIYEKIMLWRGWKESMGEVGALKLVLQDYRTTVFCKDNQFSQVMRSVLLSVEALLDYFEYEYVDEFLTELEEIDERLRARKGKKSVKVRIATVHEFKGKEADSVYIWNDSKDVYPIRDAENNEVTLEEERRVHYIACTRAKELETIVYLKRSPGMFISEMDLSDAIEVEATEGISGILKENPEEERNMRRFIKSASKSNTPRVGDADVPEFDKMSDEEFFGGLLGNSSLPSPSDMYSDNEFWGSNNELVGVDDEV